jgi:hypothetical protein
LFHWLSALTNTSRSQNKNIHMVCRVEQFFPPLSKISAVIFLRRFVEVGTSADQAKDGRQVRLLSTPEQLKARSCLAQIRLRKSENISVSLSLDRL